MSYQLRAAEKDGAEGMVHGWHIHPELELLLVESDQVPCRINDREYILSAGTLVLFNNLERHSLSVPGHGYHRLLLMFLPSYLKETIAKEPLLLSRFFYRPVPDANILKLSKEEAASVRAKMRDIIALRRAQGEPVFLPEPDASASPSPPPVLAAAHPLTALDSTQQEMYLRYALVCLVMEVSGLHRRYFPSADSLSESYSTISCMIQYIHEHMDDPALIKLDNLSKEFALSRTALCNEFKKCTGTALRQYIIDCRIWQAQEYMLAGMSIQEAGSRVGYTDNAHFSRVFHQKTGLSPRQWCRQDSSHRS